MFAMIYQPAQTAMQSGTAKCDEWVLELPKTKLHQEGQSNPWKQINLKFNSQEAAVSYAKDNNIPFQIKTRPVSKVRGRSYGENFAYDRKMPWTH